MNITRGRIKTAVKAVIYGPEGIGKSTLASKFPNPVFIDTEGSTNNMDVARLPAPSSWTMLLEEADWAKANPSQVGTLVIDTADWAEKLCWNSVINANNWKSIEDAGYGKGYVRIREEFGKLLNKLTEIAEAGINVIVTAHAQIQKFEQPDEMGAYDRYQLKLTKQAAPLLKEWADALLFCNYKTIVTKVGGSQEPGKGKYKARGSRRVVYAEHTASWDAKNRFGMPPEMDMDYGEVAAYLFGGQEASENVASAKAAEPPRQELPKKESAKPKPVQEKPPEEKAIENRQLDIIDLEHAKMEAEAKAEGGGRNPNDREAAAGKGQGIKAGDKPVSPYLSDPEKIPKELRDLMEKDDVFEWNLQDAIAAKGYYPENTLLQDLPPEFVRGWIITFWPQVKELIEEIKKNNGYVFNE